MWLSCAAAAKAAIKQLKKLTKKPEVLVESAEEILNHYNLAQYALMFQHGPKNNDVGFGAPGLLRLA